MLKKKGHLGKGKKKKKWASDSRIQKKKMAIRSVIWGTSYCRAGDLGGVLLPGW